MDALWLIDAGLSSKIAACCDLPWINGRQISNILAVLPARK
jgi:hypothetical protein